MGRPSICDSLDENAKLLQTHVSSSTHPNNTDTQTLIVCWWTTKNGELNPENYSMNMQYEHGTPFSTTKGPFTCT